jgi:hypothetical protein
VNDLRGFNLAIGSKINDYTFSITLWVKKYFCGHKSLEECDKSLKIWLKNYEPLGIN